MNNTYIAITSGNKVTFWNNKQTAIDYFKQEMRYLYNKHDDRYGVYELGNKICISS